MSNTKMDAITSDIPELIASGEHKAVEQLSCRTYRASTGDGTAFDMQKDLCRA